MSVRRRKKPLKSSSKKWNPHSYQKFCILSGVVKKHLAYFLDPGLGKTSIIIRLYQILRKHKLSKGVLVVAPLRPAFLVWPKEVQKWKNFNDVSVGVLHNDWKYPKQITIKKNFDIYVINPEGLKWLMQHLRNVPVKKWPFDTLVVDESTKFKNITSERFKILKAFIPVFKRRYILTGTPTPHGLKDIQGQMFIVDAGEAFGVTKKGFQDAYMRQVGRSEWRQYEIRDNAAREEIYHRLKGKAIRLSVNDAKIKLPDLVQNIIEVQLPKKAKEQYREMQKELFTTINEDGVNASTSSVALGKCHQIANGGLYHDQDPLKKPIPSIKRKFHDVHDAKLDALEDLIEELDGKPVFVAYHFVHDLKRLKKRFGKKLVAMESGTTSKQAEAIERRWNKGEIEILAAYPGTSALGLNLQETGEDVVWYSLTDDLEAWEQFPLRIRRQGSKAKRVKNHILVAKGTVDEVILARNEGKEKEQSSLLHAVKKFYNK